MNQLITNKEKYWEFLQTHILLLEELLVSVEASSEKFAESYAHLRIAERTFNYFLDNYPSEFVVSYVGLEEWNNTKKRRDQFAAKVSALINEDARRLEVHNRICESMKTTNQLGAML